MNDIVEMVGEEVVRIWVLLVGCTGSCMGRRRKLDSFFGTNIFFRLVNDFPIYFF